MSTLATVWRVRFLGHGSKARLSGEHLNTFPHRWSSKPLAMCLFRHLYAVTTYVGLEPPLVSVYDWKLSSSEAAVNSEFETELIAVGLIALTLYLSR